jgi:MFS family permease
VCTVAWVGNLHIGLTFFLSPIVAILSDTLGLRKTAMAGAVIATVGMVASSFVYHNLSALFFTYGVLLGIGSSLAYTPSLSILPHYFSRRLGLVNGIVVVGSPAFTSALSFLETMLIKSMGLAFTLRLLAVLYGVLLLCTLTWKTVLPASNSSNSSSSSSSKSKSSSQTSSFTSKLKQLVDVTIWKTKGYRVWVLALIVAYTGYFVPIVHLVSQLPNDLSFENNNYNIIARFLKFDWLLELNKFDWFLLKFCSFNQNVVVQQAYTRFTLANNSGREYFVRILRVWNVQPKYIGQTFPHLNPAIVITCLTVTSAISRLACGPLTDLPGVKPVRLQQFAFLLAGSVVTCLAFAANTGVLFVVIFALGVADGCMILLVGPIAVYLLGPTAASQGIGFLLGLIALPMMCGPAVAGNI